jgi:hypothetical protein
MEKSSMALTVADPLILLFAVGYIIAFGIGLEKWLAACAMGRCVLW